MAIVRNILVRVGADISSLQKQLANAQKYLNKASKQLTSVGSTLTKGITLPIAGLGAVAVKTAADFEQAMANAASVSGATAEELQQMTNIAREMGKSTVFSAKDAADAMYYMASAGYKAGQMAESIKPILDLAAATQSDLAFTTDVTIATLNQFGLQAKDASRVTNTFAAVIGNSQATIDKLAYSMRYVGPVANSLGYEVEHVTAALGLLYNAGFQGEQAGTILRGALSRLMKPTKEINETLAEMGLRYDQVNPATNNLAQIIDVLGKKGITTAQAVKIFGQEAGPGMMALISQGSQALLDLEKKITGTDAASQMAATQLDTFQGSMKLLKSAMEEVAIQIGNVVVPILRELVEKYVMPAVQWFSNLDAETQKQIITFAALAAAIGPALFMLGKTIGIAGSVVGWFNGITKAVKAVNAGTKGFGAILTAIFGPGGVVLLVIAAIAGLVALFMHLWKTNEGFRNAIISAWQAILDFLQPVFETIKTIALTVWGELKQFWTENSAAIMDLFNSTWEFIKALLIAVWDNISTVAKTVFGILQKFWETFGDTIISIFDTAWNTVKDIFNGAANILSGIMKTLTGILTGDWEKAWKGAKQVFKGVWDNIKSMFKGAVNFIIDGINLLISGLNKIKFSIPSWVPGIGGRSFGINIPKIPKLAEGGIVTGPTLAMIGEAGPEAVIPLDKMGAFGERPIIIYLDGKKIYEGVDSRLGSRALGLGVV